MRFGWRALVAAALLAAGFAVPAQAHGGTCDYYRWNASANRWERLGTFDEHWFEHELGMTRPRDYNCKYCVPMIAPPPNPSGTGTHAAPRAAQQAVEVAEDTASADLAEYASIDVTPPWGAPPGCPPLPPTGAVDVVWLPTRLILAWLAG